MKGELPLFVRCHVCGYVYNRLKGCGMCPKPEQQKVRVARMVELGSEPWGQEPGRKIVYGAEAE